MTDAIEPWVTEDMHRKLLLQQTWTTHQDQLRRAELHRADLQKLEAGVSGRASASGSAPVQHNSVSAQHIDVDV